MTEGRTDARTDEAWTHRRDSGNSGLDLPFYYLYVLISGICLYERFQKIQQRLREGQQACDLLFYVALQSLKRSFEMAFESKQGISDMEKLLAGFDEEERKKQEKAQKKREKKKKKKEKRRRKKKKEKKRRKK